MKIQTTPTIGSDGKLMTPAQVEISHLKKDNATLMEKFDELEKRVALLEAKQKEAERKEQRGPKFGPS